MRLVYWGLAIGGFVLVVSWLWGALVAFSLMILLIIGYEVWRQSRPLALSRRTRVVNAKPDRNGRSQPEAPPSTDVAAQPAARSSPKFRLRLIGEKPVQQSDQSNLAEQLTRAIPSQSAVGGDRTVIQEPLTLISETSSGSEAKADVEAIQDAVQSDSTEDLTEAPTVIESLDQIRFTAAGDANRVDWAEEPTVQPRKVNEQAIAKPAGQPSPWVEPLTIPRRLSPGSPNDSTVIRPHVASESNIAKPFQPPSVDEPTVARPFRPRSSADEKTVIGPLKAKTDTEQTIARPFSNRKTNAGGSSPHAADKAKNSPLQNTDPEKPTVIGQQPQSPKQEEERTTL